MRPCSLSVLFALAAAALGAAVPSSYVVHEKRTQPMQTWVKRGSLSPKAVLPMRIGLTQRNLERVDEFLMDVSDPQSSNYGKHWTSDQVIEAFAPKQETIDSVREWLINHGINGDRITHSDNKGWLAFDATAEEAESLLYTKYHIYEHSETAHKSVACDSYHVPKHIQEHVDYITPGIKLLVPNQENKSRKRDVTTKRSTGISTRQSDLSTCSDNITPDCIRALYEVPPTPEYPNGKPLSQNTLGIYESGSYYLQSDLNLWFTTYQPSIPNGTHPIPAPIDGAVITGNGDPLQNDAGGEANLDLTLGISLIYPQSTTLYQVDDTYYERYGNFTAQFNTFLDAIDGSYCTFSAYGETGDDPVYDPKYPDSNPGGYTKPHQCGVYKPTNVISISYGIQEFQLPAYYQQRQCAEWAKLGLQGVSVIIASGDNGVAGPVQIFGNDCPGVNGTIFNPGFPNTCPYITNVGATQMNPGSTVYQPESAADQPDIEYSSGGGFSNIFSAPSYQQSALSTYFSQHNPSWLIPYGLGSNQNGNYNKTGRGYPDVAANGWNIASVIQGNLFPSYGTSASAPIFAAMINRINEVRLNSGKGPLGFLNPAMYASPWMFNDITNGSNPGCNTPGFQAVTGWDPVTGLGTPSYERMLGIFTSLP